MANGVRALPIEGSEGGIPDAARTPLRCFDRSIASSVSQCAKSACCRGYYRIKPEVELHDLRLSLTKFLYMTGIFRHSLARAVVPWHTFHWSAGLLGSCRKKARDEKPSVCFGSQRQAGISLKRDGAGFAAVEGLYQALAVAARRGACLGRTARHRSGAVPRRHERPVHDALTKIF
jgi:hypothetical protein